MILKLAPVAATSPAASSIRRLVRLAVGLLAVGLCLGAVCDDDPGDDALSASYTPVNDGVDLQVGWSSTPGVKKVRIYYDGDSVEVDAKVGSHILTLPTRKVSLVGIISRDQRTFAATRDFLAVTTNHITLYPASDSLNPEHELHGLLFDPYAGNAFGAAADDGFARMKCTFVLVNGGDTLFLLSARDLVLPDGSWSTWSGKGVLVGDDFQNLKICPGPGAGWVNKIRLEQGRTYALEATQSDTARFVKLKVEEIEGNAVTIKVAVQKAALLRWAVTE